jgi:hypothetical protein
MASDDFCDRYARGEIQTFMAPNCPTPDVRTDDERRADELRQFAAQQRQPQTGVTPMAVSWSAFTSGGNDGATSGAPSWVTTINDIAQSWWSMFHPPTTPAAPVVDWAQQQQQQAALEQARRDSTTKTLILIGLGGAVLWAVTSKR